MKMLSIMLMEEPQVTCGMDRVKERVGGRHFFGSTS